MFLEKDQEQIEDIGLTINKVNAQITTIKSGMTYSNLVEAATIGNGILKIKNNKSQDYFIDLFEQKRNSINMVKFVPASGAATRMFKFLFKFLDEYNRSDLRFDAYLKRNKTLWIFVSGLEKFPFYRDVLSQVKKAVPNYSELPYDEKHREFIKTMLCEEHLNYSNYPKGLLPFHDYETHVSTAFEEHLFEAALYASANSKADLHFTVSEKHKQQFDETLEEIIKRVQEKTKMEFNISFSFQKESTNTIALKADNDLYRNGNDALLFRPAGHGALLENLNELDYDLVFIKNIDNIVVYKRNKKVSDYKKMLAGVLLEIQEQAFKFLNKLDGNSVLEEEIIEIALFLSNKMNVEIDDRFDDFNIREKRDYLYKKLNRPIRVCGMVKNEGEPGGGPFWVKDKNGNISLQIVEFAQIDIDNEQQNKIVQNATHFNPTDLVCAIKNYRGEKFDLRKFVDDKAAFITMKTQNGTDIKALELPGLWNGSMAYWNSIFIEIPLSTFNPVKNVNDLLKLAHQVS
ncbi:NAD metabolism ATPase/kinase [Flavivirga aquatica]|uniref:NAD metabolism ATPase/kinase n=1 Tax=Flavivirga aquatica TaxID=1849968 RepID=A0A1E5TD48_9FLAO|nr:DUF4301 family protein [Flavivirga aquatica]OEK09302.1 NAD metabolism ATPase/kinase [Flavivirga aquatica]